MPTHDSITADQIEQISNHHNLRKYANGREEAIEAAQQKRIRFRLRNEATDATRQEHKGLPDREV